MLAGCRRSAGFEAVRGDGAVGDQLGEPLSWQDAFSHLLRSDVIATA